MALFMGPSIGAQFNVAQIENRRYDAGTISTCGASRTAAFPGRKNLQNWTRIGAMNRS
jgi:hypothetical protein